MDKPARKFFPARLYLNDGAAVLKYQRTVKELWHTRGIPQSLVRLREEVDRWTMHNGRYGDEDAALQRAMDKVMKAEVTEWGSMKVAVFVSAVAAELKAKVVVKISVC